MAEHYISINYATESPNLNLFLNQFSIGILYARSAVYGSIQLPIQGAPRTLPRGYMKVIQLENVMVYL